MVQYNMFTLITEKYLNEMKPNKNKFRVLRIKSSGSNLYNNMDISRFAHISNTSRTKLTLDTFVLHTCAIVLVTLIEVLQK